MRAEPKTTCALMACPEKERFEYDDIMCDTLELCCEWGVQLGHTIRVPRMEKVSVTPRSPDSIMVAWDRYGQGWQPCLHEGKWYKQRSLF